MSIKKPKPPVYMTKASITLSHAARWLQAAAVSVERDEHQTAEGEIANALGMVEEARKLMACQHASRRWYETDRARPLWTCLDCGKRGTATIGSDEP